MAKLETTTSNVASAKGISRMSAVTNSTRSATPSARALAIAAQGKCRNNPIADTQLAPSAAPNHQCCANEHAGTGRRRPDDKGDAQRPSNGCAEDDGQYCAYATADKQVSDDDRCV